MTPKLDPTEPLVYAALAVFPKTRCTLHQTKTSLLKVLLPYLGPLLLKVTLANTLSGETCSTVLHGYYVQYCHVVLTIETNGALDIGGRCLNI